MEIIYNRVAYLMKLRSEKLTEDTLVGVAGEEIVNQAVLDYSKLDKSIIAHPMHGDLILPSVRVRLTRINQLAINDQDNLQLDEFDAVAITDGVPLLIEVKMAIMGIEKVLQPTKIQRRITPLQECFRTDRVGYGLAVYPELITDPQHRYLYRFQENKGTLIPFCMSRDAYRQMVTDMYRRLKQDQPGNQSRKKHKEAVS